MAKISRRDPVMTARVPKADQQRATRLAQQHGLSRSQLIRELIAKAPLLLSMPNVDQRQAAQR